ncbi:MAG: hypothetical protein K2N29_05875, partial [Ruminiclostridium sp.]|nr:hypothetical protein [Ruminiclostridium sp.]
LQKLPYMLVIGDNEVESGKIAVRCRARGDLGTMTIEEFCRQLREEIDKKLSIQ